MNNRASNNPDALKLNQPIGMGFGMNKPVLGGSFGAGPSMNPMNPPPASMNNNTMNMNYYNPYNPAMNQQPQRQFMNQSNQPVVMNNMQQMNNNMYNGSKVQPGTNNMNNGPNA